MCIYIRLSGIDDAVVDGSVVLGIFFARTVTLCLYNIFYNTSTPLTDQLPYLPRRTNRMCEQHDVTLHNENNNAHIMTIIVQYNNNNYVHIRLWKGWENGSSDNPIHYVIILYFQGINDEKQHNGIHSH